VYLVELPCGNIVQRMNTKQSASTANQIFLIVMSPPRKSLAIEQGKFVAGLSAGHLNGIALSPQQNWHRR
jgi:hypothetical protein